MRAGRKANVIARVQTHGESEAGLSDGENSGALKPISIRRTTSSDVRVIDSSSTASRLSLGYYNNNNNYKILLQNTTTTTTTAQKH